jgi:peptide/nickel transport system substrate-binding protein
LKKDVVFHNGKPFTSADVIYTLDAMKKNEEKYEDLFKYVSSYSAYDTYVVAIELTESVSDFYVYLDFPVICSSIDDNEAFFEMSTKIMPCGTGPFMLKKDVTQTGMILEKNPAWHYNEPYVDNLSITFMKEISTALYAFNSYQADIISSDIVKWGDFTFSNKMSIYEIPGNEYNFLAFNFENSALKDKNVRRAISLSIDKEKVVNDVMHSHGFAVNVPVNPSAYYNSESFTGDYDKDKASQLLAESGWVDLNADGVCEKTVEDSLVYLNFDFLVNESDKEAVSTAHIIKEDLKKLSIETNIVLKADEEFKNLLENKNFDLVLVKCTYEKNGDISEIIKTDGEKNYYNFSSKKTDDLMVNIDNATNKESKKEAVLDFTKNFKQNVCHVPLYFSSYAVYYQNYIKNFTYPAYNNIYNGIGDIYIKH